MRAKMMKDSGFWPLMLEGLAGIRLRKEEVALTPSWTW